MKTDIRLLAQLLDLDPPWEITRHSLDRSRRRLDLWIGLEPPRGWLGLVRRGPREADEHLWRHSNICGYACYLHVLIPRGSQPADLPWQGEPDMPFTRIMAKRIFDLLDEGVQPGPICKLWNLDLSDLWRYKYALEQGRFQAAPAPSTLPPAPADGGVPAPDNPIWGQLLQGALDIDLRALNLKLLLTRLRNQVRAVEDQHLLVMKQHELQRFFVRNQRSLDHELAQLKKAV